MSQNCTPAARVTRSLMGYGIIAGPCYIAVSLTQALTRDGFDPTTHAWSLLANGTHGWIQVANLILTGLMTIAAAIGAHRALTPGRARRWAPALITVYGTSLVTAGIFRADPAQNFPAGAPATPTVTWHGGLHLATGGVGFLCLIAACLVLAGRFTREGRTRLAWFSRGTAVIFAAGFAGIASGSHGPTTLAFTAAIIVVWAWLSTVSLHLYRTATH